MCSDDFALNKQHSSDSASVERAFQKERKGFFGMPKIAPWYLSGVKLRLTFELRFGQGGGPWMLLLEGLFCYQLEYL